MWPKLNACKVGDYGESYELRREIENLRTDLSDRNYTLADLSELASLELEGVKVAPLPSWVEDGLKVLNGLAEMPETTAGVRNKTHNSPKRAKRVKK